MTVQELLRRALTQRPVPPLTPLPAPAELTVYGADWCGDCRRAKRHLDAAGVVYRWLDLTQDAGSMVMLAAAGLRAIPVIATQDGKVLVEPSNAELARLVESLR